MRSPTVLSCSRHRDIDRRRISCQIGDEEALSLEGRRSSGHRRIYIQSVRGYETIMWVVSQGKQRDFALEERHFAGRGRRRGDAGDDPSCVLPQKLGAVLDWIEKLCLRQINESRERAEENNKEQMRMLRETGKLEVKGAQLGRFHSQSHEQMPFLTFFVFNSGCERLLRLHQKTHHHHSHNAIELPIHH